MNRLIITVALFLAMAFNIVAQVAIPFDVPTPAWEMLITLNEGDRTPVFEKANASSNVLQSQCGEDCNFQWGSNSYTPEFWDKVILSDGYILPLISQGGGWVNFEFTPEISGWAQTHNFRKVKVSNLTKADAEGSCDMLAWEQDSDLYVIIEAGGGPNYSTFWAGKLKDGYIVCPYVCYLDMDPDSNHPGILNGVVGVAGLSKFTKKDVEYILAHANQSVDGCFVAFGYIDSTGNKQIGDVLSKILSYHKANSVLDDNTVYKDVETPAAFPGGMGALMTHIARTQKYPAIAQENNEQGKVIVSFVIERDGSIGEVEIKQSVSNSLDKEAVRVIKTLPRFTPGKINGRAVRSKMTLPVTFRLN